MGVLNCTPDSFFDGGKWNQPSVAVARGIQLELEGADFIDIGGESTRPGAVRISAEEEIDRVIPVIEGLSGKVKIPISIDTSKEKVAIAAAKAGATLLNDISGGTFEPNLLGHLSYFPHGFILGHIQGTPENMQVQPHYSNVCQEILQFFGTQKNSILSQYSAPVPLFFDPGIGFGKEQTHNLQLLKNLELFLSIGEICVGVSRKSLIGKIPGLELSDRLHPSVALAIWCGFKRVKMIRVHDVKATWEAFQMLESLEKDS